MPIGAAVAIGTSVVGGVAQNAAAMMQSRPYQLHLQEAKAMGQQPMTPEQFMQMMQGKQQPGLLGQ